MPSTVVEREGNVLMPSTWPLISCCAVNKYYTALPEKGQEAFSVQSCTQKEEEAGRTAAVTQEASRLRSCTRRARG